MGTRKCLRCPEVLPLDSLNFRQFTRKGVTYFSRKCRACIREENNVAQRDRRLADPEAHNAKCKAWRSKYWASYLLDSARTNSKTRSHPKPTIDLAWIREQWDTQGGLCYWLGVPMLAEKGHSRPAQVSLDRLNPDLPYTPGNCVLSSWFANRGRSSVSEADTRDFIEVLRSTYQ